MARRARVCDCIYLTASGKFQTWHRDQDDRVIWNTFPTLEACTAHRDKTRRERAELLKTPKLVRDMRRMTELLKPPPPKPDSLTRQVVHHEENYDPYAEPPFPWRQ
jgi:hypothetical protein